MKVLLIETSGRVGKVGVASGDTLLSEAMLDRSQKHARDLIPHCQELCSAQGWQPDDLDALAVSIGPGSYTGLRVGVMTAKTLAFALNKPLLAIPTFAIIAHQCYGQLPALGSLQVIGDGQQDRVYVQRYASRTEPMPLGIETGDSWRNSLIVGETITGPGLEMQAAQLPTHVQMAPSVCWHPQLPAMLSIVLERFSQRQFADSVTLEPLYLRVSSAEEQWNTKGSK